MIQGPKEKMVRKLQGRAVAYNKVFEHNSPFVHEVLMDLAKFCRAHQSTFHADPRKAANLDGRREVFLRIMEHLQLTFEEIYRLHVITETEAK